MKRNSVSLLVVLLSLFVITACAPIAPRAIEPRVYIYTLPQIASPAPVAPVRTEKKGAAVTYSQFSDDAARLGASWCYNWSPGGECNGVEFVPMVWCVGIPTALPNGTEWLLSANEPDRADQCNRAPADYVATYRALEEKFPDIKLVAPSISQLGVEWLEQFRAAYIARYGHAPRFDALAIHCYATIAIGCIDIVNRVIMLADAWDIAGGVWVTETALLPCADGINTLNESRTLLEWLEDNPSITRYAWFASRIAGNEWWSPPQECITPLFDFSSGRHTAIGELYAGMR